MLSPVDHPKGAIGCAIADAHRFTRDDRPCFGLLILRQSLAVATRERGYGQAWAAAAVARLEAAIRDYRVEYHVEDL